MSQPGDEAGERTHSADPLARFDSPWASGAFFALVLASVVWAVWAAFQSNLSGAIIMAGAAAFAVTLAIIDARIPALFRMAFVVAATLSAGIYSIRYWPERLPYDELVHLFANWAVTSGLTWILFAKRRLYLSRDAEFLFAAALAVALSLGLVWEAAELIVGLESRADDMIVDLLMDLLGGIAAGGFLVWAAAQAHRPAAISTASREEI